MKKFMFLTYGFEKPTPEIMQAWNKWFDEIGEHIIEQGHFPHGKEISDAGVKELPLAPDSITGYLLVKAESAEQAEKMAASNPYVSSIRFYEIMSG